MAGGIKSKFKFPIPGRSSKKQEVPTVSVSTPLSKAQRILGADGINIGSSKLTVDPGRSWETGSTGGISISISESSVSQDTHDVGFEQENGRKALWEEESAIIPRQIRSAHSSSQRGPTMKRSAFTSNNASRDNITNGSTRGRRQSSSTVDTHYDSAKMPLAISQQTSNSAMARGLPTKINELLDMDGTLAGIQTGKKKKKPTRLDLSRLHPKGFKERKKNVLAVEPVLGPNYAMRSSSFLSQTLESPIPPDSTTDGYPRKLMKYQPAARQSPRSKGITEPTGLHQLYHHYEQMSFQNEETLEEDSDQEYIPTNLEPGSGNLRPASTFTHSLIAPIPSQSPRGQDAKWGHSRNGSHESKTTASIADSSGGRQVFSASRNDYAGSISSRHTRTSKASPSSKSLLGSDRLQSSVLSLSDSSDEEDFGPAPSAPLPRRESVAHDISEYSNSSKGQQSPKQLHGATSSRKFTPSLNQVDEHLAVRSASRTQNSRSPSNNTLRSSHSSMSTLTPAHLSHSAPDSRLSSRSTETLNTVGSARQSGYGVQQARVVSYVPLASTAEAASKVSMSEDAHRLDKTPLRQNSNATSHISHSSDQPTPPLSPNSVEFYVKSRESLQRDAIGSGSSEAHNARLMAVTRQEEMLLAALRQKRAKMRETVISEAEEDGKGRTSHSSRGSVGSAKRSNTNNGKDVPERLAIPKHVNSASTAWPKRASSLFIGGSRENLRHVDQQYSLRKELRDVDVPSTTSRSDVTERTSTSATESTTSTTPDSRNDQNHLYFDRHTDSIHTADSSVDFSDGYMDDSDGEDLIGNERRTSRMQSRRDSASTTSRGHRAGSTSSRRGSSSHGSQHRNDSIPTHPLNVPVKGYRLQDVPEVEIQPEWNEDVDADDSEDDLSAFPRPPMPPPSWPLPPRPERSTAKPSTHPASLGFLHPSSAMQQGHSPKHKPRHIKSKRSMVRLSAVGRVDSPMPWWGDED
ncbi:hypothetical protein F4801DRAFT_325182 [Xylaria longipes]|nr:hypothetical protein F4801DRAFT_325182 [Xylaria longipes]RYC63794.1 hypothetical protein CHU98_g2420 [Xylaria longipes]